MYIHKTLNGNTICAIGINSTDEISELAILPLNTALLPTWDKMLEINPLLKNEENKPKTKRIIIRSSIDSWYEKLDLWFDTYIAKGQIIPLVYDWPNNRELMDRFLS